MSDLFTPVANTGLQTSGFPVASKRDGIVKSRLFTASSSWACPSGVYWARLEMCGGGGGGGSSTDVQANTNGMSGSGGAGAAALDGLIEVRPGTVYTITIGAGGAGGAAATGTTGNTGTAGGTTLVAGSDGVLLLMTGGGGGGAGAGNDGSNDTATSALCTQLTPLVTRFGLTLVPGGAGGVGGSASESRAATAGENVDTVFGGTAGTGGSNNTQRSGGGGASLFGRGANGVTGGNGSCTAGATATEYGGGGSGSGQGTTTAVANTGLAGGTGGSGFVRLTWEE